MDKRAAIITGGSRGIGRAICLALASDGVNVVFSYAGNAAAADETAEQCRALGASVLAVRSNVASSTDCESLVATTMQEFGRVDILVNNAGITRDNLLMRMSEEDFDTVIATNLRGCYSMMKAVARPMIKQRSGRIINLSSVVGLMGNAGQVNYAASKAGVIGMTKSVARELASRGITANAVAPGFIATDMTAALPELAVTKLRDSIPAGRLGSGDDVASAVVFLASEQAGYITGQVLCVDGGMAMM